jgi:tetratricopeptide (TPR) repeat protein
LKENRKFHEAIDSIGQALKLDPFNADYIAELGLIYLKLGFNLRAKTIFEKAIKYDPNNKKIIEAYRRLQIDGEK